MADDLGERVEVRVRRPAGAVFAVRMPSSMLSALDERARATDRTISEVIRAAIDQYLGGTYSTSTATTLTLGWPAIHQQDTDRAGGRG